MITASDTAERIWDNPEMIPYGPSTSEISQLTNLVGILSSNRMGERDEGQSNQHLHPENAERDSRNLKEIR